MGGELVLVVEDHKGFREAVVQYLTEEGISSVAAVDAADALQKTEEIKAKQIDFDFMILDWQLPDKDGLVLLDELRAKGVNIPVIFMTAYAGRELTDRAYSRKLVAYITKGKDVDEAFIAAIRYGLKAAYQFKKESERKGNIYYSIVKFVGEFRDIEKLVETGISSKTLKFRKKFRQAIENYANIHSSIFISMSEFEEQKTADEASGETKFERIKRNILEQLEGLPFEDQYALLSVLAKSIWANLEHTEKPDLIDPDEAISAFRQSLDEQRKPFIRKIKEIQPAEEQIDPQIIDAAFDTVADAKWPTHNGKTGRKPVRLQKIREGFRDRENEYVPLDDLVKHFEGSENPRKYAASTISWINTAFEDLNINLKIESSTVNHRKGNRPISTRYRFHSTSPK